MNVFSLYPPVPFGRMFFFLLLPVQLFGQPKGNVDAYAAQPRLEIGRGNILTAGIVVRNPLTRIQTYVTKVVLPQGWRLLIRETSFELLPGQQDTRLVSVSLPAETPAGLYRIRYFISDRTTPSEETEIVVDVVILPSLRLDLQLLEAPRFVVAGRQYAVRFSVTNAGNVASRVRLTSRSSENYLLRLDSSQIALRPRETRNVTVLVSTAADIPDKVIHSLELTALHLQDSTITAKASGVVDIIPQVAKAEDRYLTYPLEVTGRASGEDDRLGGQIEIIGSGSFTEGRRDRMEVMIRTPDIQSQSNLGLRDEYRIRYTSPFGEIKIGDWSYSLSPLTELSRYAFGGEGRVEYGSFQAGGFFNESRFFTPRQRQVAGFVQYEVVRNYTLGTNYLKKEDRNESTITTFRAKAKPHQLARLDFEYGRSNAPGSSDDAYALQVAGNRPRVSYDVRYVNAGTDYTGFYRDLMYTSLNFNMVPAESFRFESYFRSEERNKRRDSTLFYAPRERFLQVGGGYSNIIAAYYRLSVQDDRMPFPQYDRREDVVQFRIGIPLKEISLFTNIDLGISKDRLGKRESPFQRYAVFTSFSPFPSHQYSTSLEYSANRNLFSGEKQERVSASVGGTVFLTSFSYVQATVYWNRMFATFGQDFALADFALYHVFPWEHRIAVRGRQSYSTPEINGRELAYVLQYSVPLAIPLKRLSLSGQLRGKILDERGRGMANVLVNTGNSAAISDRDGEFLFPSLRPDRHFLVVDKVSIGLEKITLQPMPLEVHIHGGEETRLTIDVVRRVSVSGEVVLFEFDETTTTADDIVLAGPKAGVFIECTNGTAVHRRVSDSRGRFLFTDLQPGEWRLNVTGGDIPPYHFVEKELFEFSLKAGAKEEITVRILPRKREIRIIKEGGDVVVEPRRPERVQKPAESPCLIAYDPREKGFMVQVSSWETRTKATEQLEAVRRATGLKASIERTDVPGIGRRFRVRVGPFKTTEEAESACKILEVIRDE